MKAPGQEFSIPPVPAASQLKAGAETRAWLGALRESLLHRQRAGASGIAINHANSDAMDALIQTLVERVAAEHKAQGGAAATQPFALVAVGGYARREMSLASDVDLLILVEGELDTFVKRLAETIQYELWDAGADVGAALRSVDECIALGRDDVSARTAILITRCLAGDTALFGKLGRAVRERLLPAPADFIRERQRAQATRHERFGESLYLLQPNLKEGAGGLRDYHNALWAACALEPALRSFEDFPAHGFLSESEGSELGRALDLLWRLRNTLHGLHGRRRDQLTFEFQDELASALDYPSGAELPVEALMRDYYQSARRVQNLSEIVIEECRERAEPTLGLKSVQPVEDGFNLLGDGVLEIPDAAHLQQRPLRLLSAFAVAQRHRVSLSRSALRLIREQLDLVDDAFRTSQEARDLLLRILDSEHRVMRSLMEMNETGLLARYLPEWEHIVCRWQHVIYHTYTVDVHSIFLVEQLRRLWRGKYDATLPDLAELLRSTTDLPALFLGCLLHDIGKGRGAEDHSQEGVVLARRCLERIGLAPERRERVLFIVAAHLLMSHVAQRRDLSDEKVIVEFARAVGDRENLRNLYLATFADMRASSEAGWTPWRRELLRELYERCSEYLELGESDPRRASSQIEARSKERRARALALLRELGFSEARSLEFFDALPRRYFMSHTPPQIARHAHAVFSLGPSKSLVVAVRQMRSGYSELIVCCRDRRGLFGTVTGCVAACGINILGANVYTTRAGIAFEVYRVTLPPGQAADHDARWARFEAMLSAALEGALDPGEKLRGKQSPLGARRAIASRKPALVSIRNDISDFYTVIDVTADDRLGLLYDLTRTLSAHGFEIFISKATVVLDQAADTFYVRNQAGKRLTSPSASKALETALVRAASDAGHA